ncbi:hypothetical protein [Streptomyces canus]
MSNEHSDIDATAKPGESETDEQAVGNEPIAPITSDWAPEVGEYRMATA